MKNLYCLRSLKDFSSAKADSKWQCIWTVTYILSIHCVLAFLWLMNYSGYQGILRNISSFSVAKFFINNLSIAIFFCVILWFSVVSYYQILNLPNIEPPVIAIKDFIAHQRPVWYFLISSSLLSLPLHFNLDEIIKDETIIELTFEKKFLIFTSALDDLKHPIFRVRNIPQHGTHLLT